MRAPGSPTTSRYVLLELGEATNLLRAVDEVAPDEVYHLNAQSSTLYWWTRRECLQVLGRGYHPMSSHSVGGMMMKPQHPVRPRPSLQRLAPAALVVAAGACGGAPASDNDCAWAVPAEQQPAEVREAPDTWSWISGDTEVQVSLVDDEVSGSCGASASFQRTAVATFLVDGFTLAGEGEVTWSYPAGPLASERAGEVEPTFVSFGADVLAEHDDRVPDGTFWHASATVRDGVLYVGVDERPLAAGNTDVGPSDKVQAFSGPLE